MENIKNLVTVAHNAVDEFEKYMFTNHLNIYIPAKECTEYMKARISTVESMLRINFVDEESKQQASAKLNSVIEQIKNIQTAFENGGDNLEIVPDPDKGYVVKEKTTQEVTTKFGEFNPIPSSAAKITDYDAIKNENVTELAIPPIIDDTVTSIPDPEIPPMIEPEDRDSFEQAIDVAAIEAFLGNQGYESDTNDSTLKL